MIGGDGLSCSIAAASILAKTARDRLMVEMDAVYPGYGFASHKGYRAEIHVEALRRLGPLPRASDDLGACAAGDGEPGADGASLNEAIEESAVRGTLALIAVASLSIGHPAMAATGSDDDPIPVHFKRGSDTVQLTGELKQNVRCCAYRFKAHAGQMLRWRFAAPPSAR